MASAPVASEVLKTEISKVTLKHTDSVVKDVLPTKEDLQTERKVHNVLRGVESFDKTDLKNTETEERVVLPSVDDLKTERVHHSLIEGIEGFDKNKLEHAETKEPKLPTAIDIEVERHANMPSPRLEELPKVTPDFKQELDQVKLTHTQTNVKDLLPSESDLKDERSHYQFISGIEGFNKKQLNHLDVSDQANLPSAEEVKTERAIHDVIQGVENFDRKELNHAVTHEKIHLPSAEDIKKEQAGLQ